eukprot:12932999-Prorocentrum_lima.AAC.1
MYMGFVHVARPQHMVSEHIFQVFCQDEAWMRAKWEPTADKVDPEGAYWRYADIMRTTATKGGPIRTQCRLHCLLSSGS